MSFIDDEAIRALVALEMKLSGNYITPTLNGDYYYNKPPLFNWLLLVVFQLTGEINEFTARIPTTLALFGYGATIFYFSRKHFDVKTSFLNAFIFITCGRVLFWDSILALIDITFSWVTFTAFMVVFHTFRKGNFWQLFLFTYLLTAIGFLMKGLPSVVFQGTTLLAWFVYNKRFKKLFSLEHIVGGLVFVLVVGGYYLVYHQYNDLREVFATLFSESSKRTVVNYGWGRTIGHLFTFPFEMTYHFLPWSLLVIYLFRKGIKQLLLENPFVTYCGLIFLANILVYWSSPEVYPRYLLMLVPLLFTIFLYLHQIHKTEKSWQFNLLDRLFFGVCILITLGSFAPLFLERTQATPGLFPKTISVSLGLVGLTYLYWKRKEDRMLILVLFLLVFRIGFNWFVLPDRNGEDYGNICRMSSIEAGRQFKDQPLFVYKYTTMEPTNAFYLTNTRGAIIPRELTNFAPDLLYIINPNEYPETEYQEVGSFHVRHRKTIYAIGQLK
ncbi:MAG: hypothetical protein DHS20C18_40020 [Saprospiraceae bacterium]|nr:MAG: hypothetical protein DHS20C18_40020 [Saprospiraceae bacterium]